jgi:hypothetical protein
MQHYEVPISALQGHHEVAHVTTYPQFRHVVDAKSALNANHTASRTKLASHAQRAKDVPVNFS